MRKHLVWVLGLALAIAVANVAVGANSQTIKATFSPSKLKLNKFKPGSLNVITTTGDTDGTVSPATRAKIFFDDDIVFFTRGIPVCRESQLTGTTTAQAKAACGSARVGAGQATVAIVGNPDNKAFAVVTAFNGPRENGRPTLLLHSRTEQPIGNTVILKGVLKPLPKAGDFGNVLDVTIPPLPYDTAITRFQTKVNKRFTFKGRKRSYVRARCKDNNRKLNYKGTFIYDGSPRRTATFGQPCTRGG